MRFDKALFIGFALLGAGCADFQRGPEPPDAGAKLDGRSNRPLVADYSFESEVYPVLLKKCEECHKAGGEAQLTKYILTGNARADRATVLDLVVPGNPSASLFLRRATGEEHDGEVTLAPDSAAYETVANWVLMLSAE